MGNWDLRDPFAQARLADGVLVNDFCGEAIPMLLRYRDIRRAARDTCTFSSDAPFEVPVPDERAFRAVRELPIETDPPEHTAYRALVSPLFERPKQPDMQQAVGELVNSLLAQVSHGEVVEVMRGLAFPLQSRALALLLKRPQAEGEMWATWSSSVLYDDATRAQFNDYLRQAIGAAKAAPGDDFFGILASATIDGRALTDDEIEGYAILAFAGGRDTVIAAVAFMLVHLADHPQELARLRRQPELVNPAVEEIVRICSPLTHIGRVCPQGADVAGVAVARGRRASLCWAAANRDAEAFEAPDEVRLDRYRNAHVGFGVGPHVCLGQHQARLILRTLLKALCAGVAGIDFVGGERRYEEWPGYRRQIGFESLELRIHPLPSGELS